MTPTRLLRLIKYLLPVSRRAHEAALLRMHDAEQVKLAFLEARTGALRADLDTAREALCDIAAMERDFYAVAVHRMAARARAALAQLDLIRGADRAAAAMTDAGVA